MDETVHAKMGKTEDKLVEDMTLEELEAMEDEEDERVLLQYRYVNYNNNCGSKKSPFSISQNW